MWKIVLMLPRQNRRFKHKGIKNGLKKLNVLRRSLKPRKRKGRNRRIKRHLRVTRKEKRINNNINQLAPFSTKVGIKNHTEILNGKSITSSKSVINNTDPINRCIKANVKQQNTTKRKPS